MKTALLQPSTDYACEHDAHDDPNPCTTFRTESSERYCVEHFPWDDDYERLHGLLDAAMQPLITFRRETGLDIEQMEEETSDPTLFSVAEALDRAFDDLDSAFRTLENPDDV